MSLDAISCFSQIFLIFFESPLGPLKAQKHGKLCKVDKVGISAKKWLFPEFTDFLLSLLTFYRFYQLFIEFTDFFHFYRLLNYVVFVPTFTNFFPTLPTVNRKFLITDFRLLSTSVKPKNFIDFYRSKKKMKHPRCLILNHCKLECLSLSVTFIPF